MWEAGTYDREQGRESSAKNTSFRFSIVTSIDNYFDLYQIRPDDWSSWLDATFIYVGDGAESRIQSQLNEFLSVQNSANQSLQITSFSLDNILDWPKFEYSLFNSGFVGHLHPASVIGTASSALAILLLACFNFINTSIALSGKRLKEIAIRKVLSTANMFVFQSGCVAFWISLKF